MSESKQADVKNKLPELCFLICIIIICIWAFVCIYDFETVFNFIFTSMIEKSPQTPSFALAIIAPLGGIITIYLLYKRTAATEQQVVLANETLKVTKLENIQSNFNTAIAKLSSTDDSEFSFASMIIKQSCQNHPDEFLETTYRVLISNINKFFQQIKSKNDELLTFIKNIKEQQSYDEKKLLFIEKINEIRLDNALDKQRKFDQIEFIEEDMHEHETNFNIAISEGIENLKANGFPVEMFTNQLKLLGEIRNNNKVIEAEKSLRIGHFLILKNLNFDTFDKNILKFFENITFYKCNFQGIKFENCWFKTITFHTCNLGDFSPIQVDNDEWTFYLRNDTTNEVTFKYCIFDIPSRYENMGLSKFINYMIEKQAIWFDKNYFLVEKLHESDVKIFDDIKAQVQYFDKAKHINSVDGNRLPTDKPSDKFELDKATATKYHPLSMKERLASRQQSQ